MSPLLSRLKLRRQSGSQIIEFGAALVLLVAFVLLPLLNIGLILVRWVAVSETMNNAARELAFCETLGQSFKRLSGKNPLAEQLSSVGGVTVKTVDMHLRIARKRGTSAAAEDVLIVRRPGGIPQDWLPTSDAPCTYTLVLKANVAISPAWLLSDSAGAIPGLTGPIPVSVTRLNQWENRGRNPVTGQFFINE